MAVNSGTDAHVGTGMFGNMPIKSKIGAGFSIIVVLCIVAGLGFFNLSIVGAEVEELNEAIEENALVTKIEGADPDN